MFLSLFTQYKFPPNNFLLTNTFSLGVSTSSKSLITWWVSARAEISLRPPGWDIVVITCSARAQNANFREKVYWGAKTLSMHMLAFLFRPGLKFCLDYKRLFKFLGPFRRAENPSTVWEYRARIFSPGWIAPRAESNSMKSAKWFSEDLFQKPGWNISPGWNSPCNQALTLLTPPLSTCSAD